MHNERRAARLDEADVLEKPRASTVAVRKGMDFNQLGMCVAGDDEAAADAFPRCWEKLPVHFVKEFPNRALHIFGCVPDVAGDDVVPSLERAGALALGPSCLVVRSCGQRGVRAQKVGRFQRGMRSAQIQRLLPGGFEIRDFEDSPRVSGEPYNAPVFEDFLGVVIGDLVVFDFARVVREGEREGFLQIEAPVNVGERAPPRRDLAVGVLDWRGSVAGHDRPASR